MACGEKVFGEYLAGYRSRYPPPDPQESRRGYGRIIRRARPYLIPGTTLLRNNFGVRAHGELRDLEFVATAGRLTQWHARLAMGDATADDLDMRDLHQHVFADVYPWAGSYRITELRRGDVVFAWQSGIAVAMAGIDQTARRVAADGEKLDTARLAFEMSRLYAEYNRVHPFREGNGRTGTLMLHTLAMLCGRRLDLAPITRDEW